MEGDTLTLNPGGWIYEIRQGATTVWENWNGEASRNHYSNGAVCEWIFQTVCGIRVSGENTFTIAPVPGGSLTSAGLVYNSFYGKISCSWEKTEESVTYRIRIPAGCRAVVSLPGAKTCTVDAGTYEWTVKEA